MKETNDKSLNDSSGASEGLASIDGNINHFIFENEENGYAVAVFHEEGKRRIKITVVGILSGIAPGETIRLWGRWVQNPRHGLQFEVKSFVPILPATAVGICRYLGSGLIKGIGPIFAKRIVEHFGASTLDVIDKEPDRLLEVRDIGEKRLLLIKSAWQEHRLIRDIMVFLQTHNISLNLATKIFRHYQADSIRVLRENPYQLAIDIQGIGFKTADRIAQSLGIPKDSPQRIRAGILHILNEAASDEGHTFLHEEALIEEAVKLLEVTNKDEIGKARNDLVVDGRVIIETDINGRCMVFPRALHICESGIANRLRALCATKRKPFRTDTESAIKAFEAQFKFHLAELQKDAVTEAMKGGVMVITGGPGTGKTTIIRTIIHLLAMSDVRICLASPTGRAAKRMEEATGMEAMTIHRLLKYKPREGKFAYDENNPLPADLLIIDETSMLDVVLSYHLLKAVGRHTSIIFVGDADQLPSVGPGNFLHDIIKSGQIKVIRLTEIFRQARRSLIVVNAHKINHGDFPYLPAPRDDAMPDFFFIQKNDPEDALATILKLVQERIPSRFRLDPVEDIQVITPMYKGLLGATNLNKQLQELLNPNPDYIMRGGIGFRLGDKVMQLRNNYDKDVYNGDLGFVVGFDREYQTMRVRFEGRVIEYEYGELEDLTPAYAITVHKSQGSEYPAVVMPIMTQHYIMLQRNLLYTAVTRGRRLVCLVGTKRALAIAIKNAQAAERNSALAAWLQKPTLGE